jgi:hypothetical protein
VTVKNSKSFATVPNFTQKMKALSDMSRLGGGYVNGLENKVQMDLEQRAHAHKNKERVDI